MSTTTEFLDALESRYRDLDRVCRRTNGNAMAEYHLRRHQALLEHQRELARKEFA